MNIDESKRVKGKFAVMQSVKRLLAALNFFTRIPFWKLASLEASHYENIVPLWPVAGVVTGGAMAVVLYLSSFILPVNIAVLLALLSRFILTGGLHEDGFADFCDGFGGGSTGVPDKDRERTLKIMKDSHIGTYGVIGLIFYYLLIWSVMTSLSSLVSLEMMALCLIGVDVLSKYMSSMIVSFLSYARDVSDAKNGVVYNKGGRPYLAMVVSVLTLNAPVLFFLFRWMKRRIGGYTGDCCGATFIIMELYNYLILFILCKL